MKVNCRNSKIQFDSNEILNFKNFHYLLMKNAYFFRAQKFNHQAWASDSNDNTTTMAVNKHVQYTILEMVCPAGPSQKPILATSTLRSLNIWFRHAKSNFIIQTAFGLAQVIYLPKFIPPCASFSNFHSSLELMEINLTGWDTNHDV